MQNFCVFLAGSPVLFSITKLADISMFVLGVVLISAMFFRLHPEKKAVRLTLCTLTICISVILQALAVFGGVSMAGLNVHFESLTPFICAFILYFNKKTAKQIYKPLVAAFIYNIIPIISQVIKLFIPWINSEITGTEETFGLDFLLNTTLFLILLGVYVFVKRKSERQLPFDRIDLFLYVLITITVSIFIASIAFIDRYIVDANTNNAYFMLLLNVPTFALTIAYASRKMVKSKLEADTYKMIMEQNILHYESLEAKNDELRMFRHDFPKTIAPILMCIKNGDTEEAEKILNGYNAVVQSTRPRFSTGNHRLDNVLETQAAKAEKLGISTFLENGSSFPAEGIEPADIYTIFPNALDNAIEGCLRAGTGGIIKIKSKILGNTVFVAIENPCEKGDIKSDGRGLITSKADKSLHGFGTRSIKKTVAKYGEDNISFSAENGTFTLSFSLDFKTE